MNKLNFLFAFVVGILAYGSMLLADQTSYEQTSYEQTYDYDGVAIYDVVEGEGYGYPPPANRNRRCELVVVIVNVTNDYSRERFTFWGQGTSWAKSRRDAFDRYFGSINTGRFWQSNFNHSFAYRNCGG